MGVAVKTPVGVDDSSSLCLTLHFGLGAKKLFSLGLACKIMLSLLSHIRMELNLQFLGSSN